MTKNKFNMRKNLKIFITCAAAAMLCAGCNDMAQMANPWRDCGMDLKCAKKVAGFSFPLVLSNYSVRAMDGMVEIQYPLDEFRMLTVRKSSQDYNNGDISGDFNNYKINKVMTLQNGVNINIRGDSNRIFVMYFAAESGYYSASCNQGITSDEVQKIYDTIAQVEAPKY